MSSRRKKLKKEINNPWFPLRWFVGGLCLGGKWGAGTPWRPARQALVGPIELPGRSATTFQVDQGSARPLKPLTKLAEHALSGSGLGG